MKSICWFLSMLFVMLAAGPCRAQSKDNAMTTEAIRRQVADASAKDQRLIVLLKAGASISGDVVPESDSRFQITTVSHGIFGKGQTLILNYSDVAAVKGRNPVVRTFKKIGWVSLTAVGVAAFMPFWLALEGLSFLLHGEGLPSCQVGN